MVRRSTADLKERLEQSKRRRAELRDRFGVVPLSVLDVPRGNLSRSLYSIQRERPWLKPDKTARALRKQRKLKDVGHAGGMLSSSTVRGTIGLSAMPAEIVDFFIKYYCPPGGVYADPFAGHGVRMQLAVRRGLDYYGKDASKEFYSYCCSVADRIAAREQLIAIEQGDSAEPHAALKAAGAIADFCFTSPPYWNLESYGDEPEQLGNLSYEQFIRKLAAIFDAWAVLFKPDATLVVNVGNFRRGRFYNYASDFAHAMQSTRWQQHDEWILTGAIAGTPRVFAAGFAEQQIAPRVHEFALVFKQQGG